MVESGFPAARILQRDDEHIAYYIDGTEGGSGSSEVLWCGGFGSDMTGEKASSTARWGQDRGIRVVRFDYFGHGQSSGEFRDGTLGHWKEDAAFVQDNLTQGRHILVGSSMGAWISLLLTLERPERVAGLLLLAPAPNFTERLLWNGFTEEQKRKCRKQGFLHLGEEDDDEYVVTYRQIEEARKHLLQGNTLPIDCPVRIIHGASDDVVPWQHSLELVNRIGSSDVAVTIVKNADHRLSEPNVLVRIQKTLEELL